jgi:hypothetical protein
MAGLERADISILNEEFLLGAKRKDSKTSKWVNEKHLDG